MSEANALLIADLLAALHAAEIALSDLGACADPECGWTDCEHPLAVVMAAIAKAEAKA